MRRDEQVQLIRLGRVPYRWALRLMRRIALARRRAEIGDTLLLVEHPPVITLGLAGGYEDVLAPPELLRAHGIEVVATDRGGRATYHGPGQLVAYPILELPSGDLHGYLHSLEQVVLEVLAEWGIGGRRIARYPGVWVGKEKIAAIGVAVEDGVTTHGVALNIDPDVSHFRLIVPCGLAKRGITSLRAVLGREVSLPAVEDAFVRAFAHVFGRPVGPRAEPGPWLVVEAAPAEAAAIERLVAQLGLHTVCQAAACPNLGECWARGTATFMLLGDRCTRNCRFCNVAPGRPAPPDPQEPWRVAEAAARLRLSHVVLTSVARDDLADGGAGQFAATIRAVRERLPGATVEVLVPDFAGSLSALEAVVAAQPDVFNHNVETVARLTPVVRTKAAYERSLSVLAWAKRRGLTTKSGLMVGLGETCGEVIATMRDLRRVGCELLTIGQYLQPTPRQVAVAEYVHPVLFDWYREVGEALGFRAVFAAPLVRSSYLADRLWARVPTGPGQLCGTVVCTG